MLNNFDFGFVAIESSVASVAAHWKSCKLSMRIIQFRQKQEEKLKETNVCNDWHFYTIAFSRMKMWMWIVHGSIAWHLIYISQNTAQTLFVWVFLNIKIHAR